MPPLDRAELELTAEINGATRTGTFVFLGGEENQAAINEKGRTGFLLQGAGSSIVGLLQQATDSDSPKRQGITFDLGGGQHVFDLTFHLVEGVTDASGDHYQWGSLDSVGTVNAHTATGADPRTQAQVFMNYWRIGQFDSRNPATFRWWDYSADGELSELQVAIESPSFNATAGDPAVGGSMTVVELVDASNALDALQRPSR